MLMKLIICSIPTFIFLMISVNARKETKAVCFFNFYKRPIVDDVKRHNLAISNFMDCCSLYIGTGMCFCIVLHTRFIYLCVHDFCRNSAYSWCGCFIF